MPNGSPLINSKTIRGLWVVLAGAGFLYEDTDFYLTEEIAVGEAKRRNSSKVDNRRDWAAHNLWDAIEEHASDAVHAAQDEG